MTYWESKMKCAGCGNRFNELVSLTEYGNGRLNNKNQKGYCEGCFDEKFPRLHERTENEKSNKEEG